MTVVKTKAQVFWFSGRRPIKQGAFVHGESILFVSREGGEGGAGDAGERDSAQGRA